MIYLAYDRVDGNRNHYCGPDSEYDIQRIVLPNLRHRDLPFVLRPTPALLLEGASFAYVVSWRYYVGYGAFPTADSVRERFAWLKKAKASHALRSGKAKLVLVDWYEGERHDEWTKEYVLEKFQALAEMIGMNVKDIFFVNGNRVANVDDDVNAPTFVYENSFVWNWSVNPQNFVKPEQIVYEPNKPFRYLSYARHWNSVRQFFTFELFKRDLLQYGLVSCSASSDDLMHRKRLNVSFLRRLPTWNGGDEDELNQLGKNFLKRLPLTLDADLSVNQCDTLNLLHHQQTDISVLHETHSDSKSVFLSEKTFKALYMKHPFLMVGSPGLLAELKRLGYETYSSLFDESYDEEEDVVKRTMMVMTELEKFIKREDREKALASVAEVAEFNHKHLLGTQNRTAFGSALYNALSSRL